MSQYIIGLSGGIGSGKTTVANLFAQYSIDIIDADVIARDVVKPKTLALQAISDYFGAEVLAPNGQLNRGYLRSLIFANEQHRLWLNALLHPLIRQAITTEITLSNSSYCLLVAPLLIENQLDRLVDRVLIIDIDPAIQEQRTLMRDGTNRAEVKAIIASQVNSAQRLTRADDVINNDASDRNALADKVAILHNKYLQLARSAANSSG